jgi:hypothetical protein
VGVGGVADIDGGGAVMVYFINININIYKY